MNKIVITESQMKLWEDELTKERLHKISDEKEGLENFIEGNGKYMLDITNGKAYLVQYLSALSKLVGKKYAMCAPVRKDGTYGAFYVKPYDTFQMKVGLGNPNAKNMVPMQLKGNLYQQMGLK